MKSLQEIQNQFGCFIRGDEILSMTDAIIPGGRLSSRSALEIYRDGYSARLTSLLGETYECVWRVLGDEDFFKICRSFIANENSRSYNLSDYGENFPGYLNRECTEFPWISDLAVFEWNFKNVFHEESLPAADLSGADFSRPEKIFLQVGNDVRIIKNSRSVFDIWNHRTQNDFQLPSGEKINQEEHGFLYKKNGLIYFEKMTPSAVLVIEDLSKGKSLLESLEGKESLGEDGVMDLFSRMVAAGIIKSLRCSS